MSKPIVVLEEAFAEASDAIDYLEDSRPGLGAAFTAALAETYGRLQAHPEIGASAELGNLTRRWSLARFPYSIIYLVGAEQIIIVAIPHEHRRPGYWRARTRR